MGSDAFIAMHVSTGDLYLLHGAMCISMFLAGWFVGILCGMKQTTWWLQGSAQSPVTLELQSQSVHESQPGVQGKALSVYKEFYVSGKGERVHVLQSCPGLQIACSTRKLTICKHCWTKSE